MLHIHTQSVTRPQRASCFSLKLFLFNRCAPCLKLAFALFQSDMASGVKVDEVVKLKYDDIKKKKSYRYLVFYIKDEKVIQVEKVGDRNADYQEFLQDLYVGGPDDCR